MKQPIPRILVFCLCIFVGSSACDSIFGLDKAEIVLDGQVSILMKSYGSPYFVGWVKNIGKKTGYNCSIKFIVYSDSGKKNIVDTATGFPGNLGDIAPDTRASFEAICFGLNTIEQIVAYDHEIDWLDRK